MKNTIELSQEQRLQQKLLPQQLQLGKYLEMEEPAFLELISTTVAENPALEIKKHNDEASHESPIEDSSVKASDQRHYSPINSQQLNGEPMSMTDNSEMSLTDYLQNQIPDIDLTPDEQEFLEYLIGNLDSRGFLNRNLDELAEDYIIATGVEFPWEVYKSAWEKLREMDPSGIGAIDLQDSLLLQLQRAEKESPEYIDAHYILENYFEQFIAGEHKRLKELTKWDELRLNAAIKAISRLNPWPGREFSEHGNNFDSGYITPQFAILPDVEQPHTLSISLLSEVPELTIEKSFSEDGVHIETPNPTARKKNRDAALFLKNRREEARNFIELVKLRQQTLLRVITAIATLQKDFFLTGDWMQLKPMVLKDVAAKTNDDLSVLSRATSGRFVLTTAGIVPLKDLFNEGINSTQSAQFTPYQLEQHLLEIIAQENKAKPFADEELAKRLKEKGFDVARRTVAKYRESLNIPNAHKRKIQ